MQVKFRVNQPFNFTNYSYVVVFNTSSDGTTPRANGTQTAYSGYSFAIVVSAIGNSVSAMPYFFFRTNVNSAPILLPVNAVAGQLQFNSNSNGQNTEFTVLFNRVLASAYTTPSPGATATPTTSPTASATPTGSPAASPTPSPTSTPPSFVATTWQFNYFVVQGTIQQNAVLVGGPGAPSGNGLIVDSLGQQGPNDSTYTSPNLDTTVNFDTGSFYPLAGNHASDPSAQIASGDISNNP